MEIAYTPQFLRMFRKLERSLQEESVIQIELFRTDPRNPSLKVHKLKGKLKNRYSFSINYQVRIVYIELSKTEVAFLAIGDHDIYR